MPKAHLNGTRLLSDSPTRQTAATPETTPRRSKRKLDAVVADAIPSSQNHARLVVNGNVKATERSSAPEQASPKTPRIKGEKVVDASDSPDETRMHHTSIGRKDRKTANKVEEEIEKVETKVKDIVVDGDKTKKGRKRTSEKASTLEESDIEEDGGISADLEAEFESKPKKKRKTKEEKEAEMLPLAARTAGVRKFVGAHVSMAGGLENAVKNCERIGGNAFALFLRSQKKWDNPPLKDETRAAFVALAKEKSYDVSKITVPHGSYLVNLAVEDADRAKQAYDTFVDDLHRCESLGIKLYNFHPGAFSKSTLDEGINRIASQLNKALSATKTVIPLLENAAGAGTVIGSRFSDLRDIIGLIAPQHKHRIGVCIDTCHAFAAGYDLRTPSTFKSVLDDFDSIVGLQYLKALHINDSKAPLDSKKDLHQNIGLGFLGLRAFHNIMNEPRLEDLPLILETPCDIPDPKDLTGKKTTADYAIWAREIKLLESLVGMDPECDSFKSMEATLSDKGKAEREKIQASIDSMQAKKSAKATKALEKGQKTLASIFGGGGSSGGSSTKKTKDTKASRTKQTTSKQRQKKNKGSAESENSDSSTLSSAPRSDID